MQIRLTSRSVDQTREIGKQIGENLSAGTVIGIDGTLGAGKTHLVQGIATGLGVPAKAVVSPTYTICIPYDARLPMLHLDAYRIKSPCEVDELGLDEAVDGGAVLIVEWASLIENLLPELDLRIEISQPGPSERSLSIAVGKVAQNGSVAETVRYIISVLSE